MAARRLLIVMLVLLGLSTLAAALVPNHSLRGGGTTGTTSTQPTTTQPASTERTQPSSVVPPVAEITVGGKKFPVVPVQAGEQFTLLVLSHRPQQISIPEFGLVGFATADTPARFELLPDTSGTFGILSAGTDKPEGQIQVLARSSKEKAKKGREKSAKSRARAG
jgi:hypothetical protein